MSRVASYTGATVNDIPITTRQHRATYNLTSRSGIPMDSHITIRPTSHRSAEAGDVVLRETTTTRLVFRSEVVQNPNDPDACVRGHLVHQRKGRSDNWEDKSTLKLNQLKKDEWVKFTLKSKALQKLVIHANNLYELHAQQGIPAQPTRFAPVGKHLGALLDASSREFTEFLRDNEATGIEVLIKLLNWISEFGDPRAVIDRLTNLDADTLEQVNAAAGIGAIRQALHNWEAHRDEDSEDFWHEHLIANQYILGQIFAFPIICVEDKAYVGGKKIDNRGGKLVDFLVANRLSKNAVLVEIKTPETPLLGSEYRNGVYGPSSDISGAVAQVRTYRQSLIEHYPEIAGNHDEVFDTFYPRCAVIAGDFEQELTSEEKRQSFEQFRNGLRDVDVISFDELFEKLATLVKLLEGTFDESDSAQLDPI